MTLVPRVKSPIGAALSQAGDMALKQKGRSNIILISDGVESCGANICAIAETLKAQNIDITAHVIGLNLSQKEENSLRCIAQKTKGQFMNITALKDIDAVLSIEAATPQQSSISSENTKEEEEDSLQIPFTDYIPSPFANVVMDARVAPESEPITEALIWRIFRFDDKGKKQLLHFFEIMTPPQLRLDEGDYLFEVEAAGEVSQKRLTIAPRIMYRQSLIIPLGSIKLAVYDEEQQPLDDVSLTLTPLEQTDETQNRKTLTKTFSKETTLLAKEGKYRMLLHHKAGEIAQNIEVKKGEVTPLALHFGLGSMIFMFQDEMTKRIEDGELYYQLYTKEDKEAQKSKDLILKQPYLDKGLQLPPGHYTVIFSLDNSNIESQIDFEVNAKRKNQAEVNFTYNKVQIIADFAPQKDGQIAPNPAYMILDETQNRVSVGTWQEELFWLKAGRYELLPLKGEQQQRLSFEVKSNEDMTLHFND